MIGVRLSNQVNWLLFLSVASKKFFEYTLIAEDFDKVADSDLDLIVTDFETDYSGQVKVVVFGKDFFSFEDLQQYVSFQQRVDDEYVNSLELLLEKVPDEALDCLPSIGESEESGEMTLGEPESKKSEDSSVFDGLPLGDLEVQEVFDDVVSVSIENLGGDSFEEDRPSSLDCDSAELDKLASLSDALFDKFGGDSTRFDPNFVKTPEAEIEADNRIVKSVDEALKGLFEEEKNFEESLDNAEEMTRTLREEKVPEPQSFKESAEEESLFEKMMKESRSQEILRGFSESTKSVPTVEYQKENESWLSSLAEEKEARVKTLGEKKVEEQSRQSVQESVANESRKSQYIVQSASPYNGLSTSTKPMVASHRISACFSVPNVPVVKPKQQSRQLRGVNQSKSSRRKVILVGGAGYDSFSTTVAINLAYDYRRYYNKNVLLIDLDCVSGGATHTLKLSDRTQCSIASLFTQDFKFYCNKLANFVATVNVGGVSLDVVTACFLDFISPVDRELIENYSNFSSVFMNILESTKYETIVVDMGSIDRLTAMQSSLLKNGCFLSLVCVNSESRQVLSSQAQTLGEVPGDYNILFTKSPSVLNTARLSQQLGRNVLGQVSDYPSPNVDLPLYSNMVNSPVQKEWFEILRTLLGVREY